MVAEPHFGAATVHATAAATRVATETVIAAAAGTPQEIQKCMRGTESTVPMADLRPGSGRGRVETESGLGRKLFQMYPSLVPEFCLDQRMEDV